MSNIKNKVVLITGAGTGLGRELALLMAEQGAELAVCARTSVKMEQLEKDLQSYSVKSLALTADVSREEEVKALVGKAVNFFGRIDILINNAAVFENSSVMETSLDSWNYQFQNNVTGTFLMSRECIPVMRRQKAGQIINLTSGLAKTGANGFGAYSASKAAIETLSYTMEEEERRNGIHVHVVNPGVMKTNMQAIGDHPKLVAEKLIQFIGQDEEPQGKVIQMDKWHMPYHI